MPYSNVTKFGICFIYIRSSGPTSQACLKTPLLNISTPPASLATLQTTPHFTHLLHHSCADIHRIATIYNATPAAIVPCGGTLLAGATTVAFAPHFSGTTSKASFATTHIPHSSLFTLYTT
ncbi:hypothetical protein ACQRIU_000310 [Beauveria bassiana]